MKNNITYFTHDTHSYEHPKFKMLRVEYWWEWYWKFWTLNEMIWQAEDCLLDLSKKFNKFSIASDLDFSVEQFEWFIDFLINECNLLTETEDWKITTERIQEVLEWVMKTRKKAYERYKKKDKKPPKKDKFPEKKEKFPETSEEFLEENIESKVKEIKVNEIKIKENKYSKESFEYKIAKKYFDFHFKNQTPSLLYLLSKKKEEEILQDWADPIEKLKRIDKYTEDQISFIINFTSNDDFWFEQIKSTAKFRKKNREWIPYFVVMIEKAKKWQKKLSPKKWSWITSL